MDNNTNVKPKLVFTQEELKNHSDDSILEILKTSWGYDINEPLIIFGQLKKKYNFFLLENLWNKNSQSVYYPLNLPENENTVFVGKIDKRFAEGEPVKVTVTLSPNNERQKRKNPFALTVIKDSIQPLVSVPKHILQQGVNEDKGYLEKWVIDYVAKKNLDEIARIVKQEEIELSAKNISVRKALDDLLSKQEVSKADIEKNIDTIQKQEKIILDKNTEIEIKQNQLVKAELELRNIIESKEDIVNKLNKFIENKAKLLHDLDIVDEQVLNHLTSSWQLSGEARDGYSLSDDFFDIENGIAYVQAYLYNKGIMYRREVLENFYTLLSTRDLIILAGDSGSGKTNLVKSFADAIGGKSFIIPVKPNWTGSEDLLGYYNPIEQSYLSTQFLDALLEAEKNPQIPYFICLDEMNLARVEYYFADFLSLLEERSHQPIIHLYSQSESSHLLSEMKNFLALLNEARDILHKDNLETFVDILKDEELNQKLHELCGFKDGDSLLKYHARLRKSFASYINNPAAIQIPNNVFFIGAINIDETTHYLSPKILDRAHIMRFINPLLQDWDEIDEQIVEFEKFDMSKPVLFNIEDFGFKKEYPDFEADGELERDLINITKNYLIPLGVEFGLRSIRQAKNYLINYQDNFDINEKEVLNNIVRQKILPKLMFDGTKKVTETKDRKDILGELRSYLHQVFAEEDFHPLDDSVEELNTTLKNAEINDWVVNYWFK